MLGTERHLLLAEKVVIMMLFCHAFFTCFCDCCCDAGTGTGDGGVMGAVIISCNFCETFVDNWNSYM